MSDTPDPKPLCDWTDQWVDRYTESHTVDSDVEKKPVRPDYWVWRSWDEEDYLILDHGPLACDHLPAHGHADLLTLEASIQGRRFFVDSGTYDYEDSTMRAACRGTAGHNTLQVDGLNHADIWSRFRMGRRGRPLVSNHGRTEQTDWVYGFHDAYKSIGVDSAGKFIAAQQGPLWLIVEWIDSYRKHEVATRLRLHPDVDVASESQEANAVTLKHRDSDGPGYQLNLLGDSQLNIEEGWYCPNFGQRDATKVLVGKQQVAGFGWIGWLLHPSDQEADISIAVQENAFYMQISGGDTIHVPKRIYDAYALDSSFRGV